MTDRGIAAALEAHLAKSRQRAVLEVRPPDVQTRFAPEVEAAVYFCVLEAIQNSTKHAPDSDVRVCLHLEPDRLHFEVKDDGRGFDPAQVRSGTGVQNMRDRLAAVGGTLEVQSAPGHGTLVLGSLCLSGHGPPRPVVA